MGDPSTMARRSEAGGGFSVLDGAALVTGAAVASVHIRTALPEIESPAGWLGAWCLFSWLSMTAAGPFVFLVRRFFTRPAGYPRLGDRLWAISGLPWLLAGVVRTFEPASDVATGRLDPAYVGSLSIGLGLAAMIAVPMLAARTLLGDASRPKEPEPNSWTHRFGIFLTIAWPIQCGVGLIMME